MYSTNSNASDQDYEFIFKVLLLGNSNVGNFIIFLSDYINKKSIIIVL